MLWESRSRLSDNLTGWDRDENLRYNELGISSCTSAVHDTSPYIQENVCTRSLLWVEMQGRIWTAKKKIKNNRTLDRTPPTRHMRRRHATGTIRDVGMKHPFNTYIFVYLSGLEGILEYQRTSGYDFSVWAEWCRPWHAQKTSHNSAWWYPINEIL